MKAARGTAGAPWGSVDRAARSRGGMLLLANCHGWVFVVATAPAPTHLGLENHPAEWINLKMVSLV